MHEYSIVAALVDRVREEVDRAGASRVKRLFVRIGDSSGVDVPLLATAFETFRERTVCEGADLVIDAVETRWSCPACGTLIARGEKLRCPTCDVPARLSQGAEIILARIEMEVPDV
jgi:hydrogenase nickel incorporation protein HypA/HybF